MSNLWAGGQWCQWCQWWVLGFQPQGEHELEHEPNKGESNNKGESTSSEHNKGNTVKGPMSSKVMSNKGKSNIR